MGARPLQGKKAQARVELKKKKNPTLPKTEGFPRIQDFLLKNQEAPHKTGMSWSPSVGDTVSHNSSSVDFKVGQTGV